jgi:phage terminase small subunit
MDHVKKKRTARSLKRSAPATTPPAQSVKRNGVTAERSTAPLTPKQARFVAEYLVDLNAAAAARRAGYSAKTADQQGYENLKKPEIAAAVQAGQTAQLATAGVSKARLLQELGRIALVNVRDYFDPETKDARLPSDLTDDQGACLAGFEVLIKNAKAGDGVTDTIHKFKLWDKVRALELYMKHYGMLVEKIEVKDSTADARVARLVAARSRAGK